MLPAMPSNEGIFLQEKKFGDKGRNIYKTRGNKHSIASCDREVFGKAGHMMKRPSGSIKTLFIACIIVITGVLLTIQTFINVSQFQESMGTQVKL